MKTKLYIKLVALIMKKLFLFALTFCLLFTVACEPAGAVTLYALSAKKGLLVSDNMGKSWKDDTDGLPDKVVPVYFVAYANAQYLTTESSGIFFRKKRGEDWRQICSSDFRLRRSFLPSSGDVYRKVSAFAVDPANSANIAAATKHSVYVSANSGEDWRQVSSAGMGERHYITALCIDGKSLYAGTSFNGMYSLKDIDAAKPKWTRSARGLPQEPYSTGLYFTEEFSSLSKWGGRIYAGFRFGKGCYVKDEGDAAWRQVYVPAAGFDTAGAAAMGQGSRLYLTVGTDAFVKQQGASGFEKLPLSGFLKKELPNEEISLCVAVHKKDELPPLYFYPEQKRAAKGNSKALDKRAIYSSVWAVRKKLDYYIKLMHRTNINAIVIDMKDDFGSIYYPTNLQTAKDINAAKQPIAVKDILAKLHAANIYVIARVVTFKDEKLFKGYGGKYAIKDSATGNPWRGAEGEYWVDPYSQFVQDYNISIGGELEKLGFDEIQFDYIRFPSDGPTHRCVYSFKQDAAMYKSEILCEFLLRAKEKISVPVSTDIYGFNSWYSFGNWIGQDMEEFARIVDVVCPMVYPSHFGNRFYMNGPRETRSYRIVLDGAIRANRLTAGSACIRPYLQGFRMMSPTWGTGYINNQVNAAKEGDCSGFTFWNASGDYAMVDKALSEEQ